MEEKRYWFKNRKLGVGWSPATWEGWLCVGLFALWAVGVAVRFEKLGLPDSAALEQIVFPIFFGVFVLIVVSIRTGEPLKLPWKK